MMKLMRVVFSGEEYVLLTVLSAQAIHRPSPFVCGFNCAQYQGSEN